MARKKQTNKKPNKAKSKAQAPTGNESARNNYREY